MSNKDSYYSYDVDTDEIVAKTVFSDNGRVDRFDGINKPGYGHKAFEDGKALAKDEPTWSRSVGEDPDREWKDRDGVL